MNPSLNLIFFKLYQMKVEKYKLSFQENIEDIKIGELHIFLPEKIVDLFAGTNTTKEFIRYAMTAMQDRAKELDRLGFDMEDLDALSYFRPLNPTNREKSIDYMKLLKLSQDNEDSPPDPDQHDHQ